MKPPSPMTTSTVAITTARGRSHSKPPLNEKQIRRRNASQTAARGLVQRYLSQSVQRSGRTGVAPENGRNRLSAGLVSRWQIPALRCGRKEQGGSLGTSHDSQTQRRETNTLPDKPIQPTSGTLFARWAMGCVRIQRVRQERSLRSAIYSRRRFSCRRWKMDDFKRQRNGAALASRW